jgi:hypothetical protein
VRKKKCYVWKTISIVDQTHTVTTGEEGDISNLIDLRGMTGDTTENILQPFQSKGSARQSPWPAKGEGNEMCQWILKANGKMVPRRSVRPLQKAEIHSPSELKA